MKKIFALITLLLLLTRLGAYAGWSYQYGQYSGQCVVYADLVDGSGHAVMNGNFIWRYTLGAFINGKCRGEVKAEGGYFPSVPGEVCYFPLRIEGTAADNGKKVEFRLMVEPYNSNYTQPMEYIVVGTTTYKYQNGFTPPGGPAGNRHHLKFIEPKKFELSPDPIRVNVGQTIDLNNYVKLMPANANKPINTGFQGYHRDYFTITDYHLLKGIKENEGSAIMKVYYQLWLKEQLAEARVIVERQTVTGLTLAPGYGNGVVVNLNDVSTLTYYVRNAFKILPEGVTVPLQLTPSDPSALVFSAVNGEWIPKKVGNYTIRATYGNYSATLKVKVQQRATALKTHLSDLYVYKGNNITNLLKANVYPEPAGSVYNKLKFRVIQGSSLQIVNNEQVKAVEEGDAVIEASTFSDSIYCSFKVHVQPVVTSLSVTKNPLDIDWNPNGNAYQNISTEVLGNFAFAPTALVADKYQLTSDAPNIVEVVGISPTTNYNIVANGTGRANLTVTYTDKETRLNTGSTIPYNTERTLKETFGVNIVQGLKGLKAHLSDLYVYKGNDITNLLKANVYPDPEDFVYNNLKFKVIQGSSLRIENNGQVKAVEEGEAVVQALADNDVSCSFKVHVQPVVTNLSVTKNPLDIDWNPNGNAYQNISTEVLGNFAFTPTALAAGIYQLTSDAPNIVEVVGISPTTNYNIVANSIGTAHLTITYTDKETRLETGSTIPYNTDRTLKKTFTINVIQGLKALKTHLLDLYVYKGNDITNLLKANVYPDPEDAVYSGPKFTVTQGSSLRIENNGQIKAVEEGEAVVQASTDNGISCSFKVHVQPVVTNLNITKDPLNIDWLPNGNGYQDVSTAVLGNFAFTPTAPAADKYQFTSDDPDIVEVNVNPTANYYVLANGIGTAHLTVTYTDKETRLNTGSTIPYNTERTLTKTFTVNVMQSLTGFTCDNIIMGHRTAQELKLTPVPATAPFDPARLNVVITNNDTTFPAEWKFTEVAAADATGLKWTIKPRSVGKGTIDIQYNGTSMGQATIIIGQELNDAAGWQWHTYFTAPVDKSRLQQIYGDKLLEIRSDNALLYNDAQYGYFGTLTGLEKNKCYKVRLKDGVSPVNVAAATSTIDYRPNDGCHIYVKQPWSWIAYPYQYDRPLSSIMLDGIIVTGSRIVSKDSGFAEYNGSGWTGDLTTLKAGEGYMFYNPDLSQGMDQLYFFGESMLPQPAAVSPAKRNGPAEASIWTYNSATFADNMTIIAEVPDLTRASDYTVGAFVGDECRGEGRLVEGLYFITVHGKGGETVSFKLYDKVTGEYRLLAGDMKFDKIAGSLAKPVVMKAGGTTSVGQITAESSEITVVAGRLRFNGLQVKSFRVSSVNGNTQLLNETDLTRLPLGVYIVTVVTTDGRTLSQKVVR